MLLNINLEIGLLKPSYISKRRFGGGSFPHPSTPSVYDLTKAPANTNIQDSLFSRVLARMPVFPILKLLVSALVLPKHNHDDALKTKGKDTVLQK